jgi:hypothetical protein
VIIDLQSAKVVAKGKSIQKLDAKIIPYVQEERLRGGWKN